MAPALDDAIETVKRLRGLPAHKFADAGDHAWEQLRSAVMAEKADVEAFDGYPQAAMHDTLEFLVKWSAQKKVVRGKIRDCIKILLLNTSWLQAAQAHAELRGGLQAIYEGNSGMQAMLTEGAAPASRAEAPPAAGARELLKGDEAAEHGAEAYDAEAAQLLRTGLKVMESFVWAFPGADAVDADKERAVGAFKAILQAVNRLCSPSIPHGTAFATVSSFDQVWPHTIPFFRSMCHDRKPFQSKIRFVMRNLRDFSESFDAAVARDQFFQGFLSGSASFLAGSASAQSPHDAAPSRPAKKRVAPNPCEAPLAAQPLGRGFEGGASGAHERPPLQEMSANHQEGDFEPAADDEEDSSPKLSPRPSPPPISPRKNEEPVLHLFRWQWMWADARMIRFPGLHYLAEANPFRWSDVMSLDSLLEDLETHTKTPRPVQLRSGGGEMNEKFEDAQSAIMWIRKSELFGVH